MGINFTDGEMFVTEDILRRGCSDRGGWTNRQLSLLGIDTPLPKGWRRNIVGKRVPARNVLLFIRLKNHHLPAPGFSLFGGAFDV